VKQNLISHSEIPKVDIIIYHISFQNLKINELLPFLNSGAPKKGSPDTPETGLVHERL
jgi:hypothetical protein